MQRYFIYEDDSLLPYRCTINYLSGNVLQLKTLSSTLISIDYVIYRGVIVLVSIEAESSHVSLTLPCKSSRVRGRLVEIPEEQPGAILSCD